LYSTATNGGPPSRPSPAPAASPDLSNGNPPPSYHASITDLTNSQAGAVPQSIISKDPKAAAAAAADIKNIVRRKLTGYVGFANLPNQWHRKSVRKGFNFNVMVVGMFMVSCVSEFGAID
jgi:septin 7